MTPLTKKEDAAVSPSGMDQSSADVGALPCQCLLSATAWCRPLKIPLCDSPAYGLSGEKGIRSDGQPGAFSHLISQDCGVLLIEMATLKFDAWLALMMKGMFASPCPTSMPEAL
jgi:hypothetical protein